MLTENDAQIRTIKSAGLIAFVFAVTFSIIFYVNQLNLETDLKIVLSETINPNTAEAESIVRLPAIGPKRAQAIIDYRNDADTKAFENINDLQKIKGIGPKTAGKLQKWLYFGNEN